MTDFSGYMFYIKVPAKGSNTDGYFGFQPGFELQDTNGTKYFALAGNQATKTADRVKIKTLQKGTDKWVDAAITGTCAYVTYGFEGWVKISFNQFFCNSGGQATDKMDFTNQFATMSMWISDCGPDVGSVYLDAIYGIKSDDGSTILDNGTTTVDIGTAPTNSAIASQASSSKSTTTSKTSSTATSASSTISSSVSSIQSSDSSSSETIDSSDSSSSSQVKSVALSASNQNSNSNGKSSGAIWFLIIVIIILIAIIGVGAYFFIIKKKIPKS